MRRRFTWLTVGLLLAWPSSGFATTYYVDSTNASCTKVGLSSNPAAPSCAISQVNAASLSAGDIVQFNGTGEYNETLTPPNNGTSLASPITFIGSSGSPPACGGSFSTVKIRDVNLASKEFITIQGLEITNAGAVIGASGNTSIILAAGEGLVIIKNYIHDTTNIGIGNTNLAIFAGPQTERLRIAYNTICNTGDTVGDAQTGVRTWSKWTLVEYNAFSGNQDAVQINGSYGIVRNNDFGTPLNGGNGHLDAFQVNACAAGALEEGWNYVLFEGNAQDDYQNSVHDHSWVVNGVDDCSSGGWSHGIFRYNNISNIGSGVGLLDGTGQYAAVYNNTIVNANTLADQQYVINSGATGNGDGTLTTVLLNNIFVNAIVETVFNEAGLYSFRAADATSRGNGNLARLDADPTQTWDSPYTAEGTFNALKNQDPDFVNQATGDFRLQVGSPAINVGVSLTLANGAAGGGSSVTLVVDDAQFFQDDWDMSDFGVLPDEIAIGTVTNTVAISSINYATNTITLASAKNWSDNADVWLYKKSDGTIVLKGSAPDLGANETDPTGTNKGGMMLLMQPKPKDKQ